MIPESRSISVTNWSKFEHDYEEIERKKCSKTKWIYLSIFILVNIVITVYAFGVDDNFFNVMDKSEKDLIINTQISDSSSAAYSDISPKILTGNHYNNETPAMSTKDNMFEATASKGPIISVISPSPSSKVLSDDRQHLDIEQAVAADDDYETPPSKKPAVYPRSLSPSPSPTSYRSMEVKLKVQPTKRVKSKIEILFFGDSLIAKTEKEFHILTSMKNTLSLQHPGVEITLTMSGKWSNHISDLRKRLYSDVLKRKVVPYHSQTNIIIVEH